ncbi:MAG: peptidyl-prolyl cis-trans isomerase [Candidatus Aminicenantes bacterium]|nr:peptidyl-prolyl cis-trans isomerase [Candidatus Aminicenantes bacterium]
MKMVKLTKSGLVWMSLSAALFIFVQCNDRSPSEVSQTFDLSDPEKRIQIILRVQDVYYFNADFEKYLQLIAGDEFDALDLVSLSRLVDSFIEDKMFLNAARNGGLSVSLQEQKQYLAKASNDSFPYEKDIPLNEMETQSLLERFLVEKYIYEKVKNIEVRQDEIKDYYDLNKREFLRPERMSVSQILLDTEEKAVEVFERLRGSSEGVFQKIAKEVSLGVEASKGGRLGIFEMNQLPAEMEKVIFSLKEGETSQVVESAYGFHIFRLDKKFEPKLEAQETVSAEIRVKILDLKIKQFISQHLLELRDALDLEFYPKNLSFPYQRNSNE